VISKQLGQWAPLSIPELSQILVTARSPWWVAGRHAIDLAFGRTTRHHEDLDVESFAPTNTGLETCSPVSAGICMSPPAAACGSGAEASG
jgi:hypothetical protein